MKKAKNMLVSSGFIENNIFSYIYEYLNFELWKGGFPIKDLLGLKIPNLSLSSLSVGMIDFPEIILVGVIGFCGVIPYPYVIMINAGDVDVPGVITGRTIQLISLDLKKPIKVVKVNFGSYILPVGTMIEDYVNSGMGLYFDPNSLLSSLGVPPEFNVGIPSGSIKDIGGVATNVLDKYGLTIDSFLRDGEGLLKTKVKIKDLYNMFEVPNPNILCKVAKAKSFSEGFDIAKSSLRIDGNRVPPELSKLEEFRKYGLLDLDGELLMSEVKSLTGAVNYPKISDVLNLTTEQKNLLLLDKLGVSKKALFDLIPPLSAYSLYIQDDLPPYERLSINNIPFLVFLIQFCIAGKKGAKLPFLPPEVFPYLEMS
jgi:hypothetical protein